VTTHIINFHHLFC